MVNKELQGWTANMRSIHYTFYLHNHLLLLFTKLDLMGGLTAGIMQRNFEQNLWSKIRDGDDYDPENLGASELS